MTRTRPWELGDDLWERAQPPLTLRQMSGAILYVLHVLYVLYVLRACLQ